MRGARAFILAAMVAALAGAAGAQTPLPRQPVPQLTLPQTNVQLTAPTRREGAFSAGGMEWRCNGLVCTSQTVAVPSVAACRALMGQAGAVASYARARVSLAVADIAACNQAPLPSLTHLPPSESGANTAITTPELNFVGGAVTTPSDRGGAPMMVNASELNFVGGATSVVTDRGAPVEITTGELNFVGGCRGVTCVPLSRR